MKDFKHFLIVTLTEKTNEVMEETFFFAQCKNKYLSKKRADKR